MTAYDARPNTKTGNHIQKGHVFDNMILDIIILPTLFAATQLFKLMDKYRPETKQAKKERLRERAAARLVLHNFISTSDNFNSIFGKYYQLQLLSQLDRAVRPVCLSARALGNIKSVWSLYQAS